jgi:hypothetical protein
MTRRCRGWAPHHRRRSGRSTQRRRCINIQPVRHRVRRAPPARRQRTRDHRVAVFHRRERNSPASRPVDVHDDSAFEASGLDEFQAKRHGQFREQRLPAANGHWLDDQAVLIDQPLRGKGRGEAGATVGDDIRPWLLLQRGDLRCQIATGYPGGGPGRAARFVSALWPGAARMPAPAARTMAVTRRRRFPGADQDGRWRPVRRARAGRSGPT